MNPIWLPITRGHLRGRKWSLRSRGKMLRVLLGTYDRAQTELFVRVLRPGMVVFDVGAHAGYFTLLATRLTAPSGRVVAFEPDAHNAASLKANVRLNGLANVVVVDKAVADTVGRRGFRSGTGSGTGRLSDSDQEATVETTTLDAHCLASGLAPAAIKIDVEGAEFEVLAGAERTVTSHRPQIFLSTHGAEIHRRCCEWLTARDYALQPIGAGTIDQAHGVFAVSAPR